MGNATGKRVDDARRRAVAEMIEREGEALRRTARRYSLCAADAEDASQAVFLLLAEKAGRVRWQGSVAGGLYTVARRVARNARLSAERRARRESRAAVPESVAPVDTMTGRELLAFLAALWELTRGTARARIGEVVEWSRGIAAKS